MLEPYFLKASRKDEAGGHTRQLYLDCTIIGHLRSPGVGACVTGTPRTAGKKGAFAEGRSQNHRANRLDHQAAWKPGLRLDSERVGPGRE